MESGQGWVAGGEQQGGGRKQGECRQNMSRVRTRQVAKAGRHGWWGVCSAKLGRHSVCLRCQDRLHAVGVRAFLGMGHARPCTARRVMH